MKYVCEYMRTLNKGLGHLSCYPTVGDKVPNCQQIIPRTVAFIQYEPNQLADFLVCFYNLLFLVAKLLLCCVGSHPMIGRLA